MSLFHRQPGSPFLAEVPRLPIPFGKDSKVSWSDLSYGILQFLTRHRQKPLDVYFLIYVDFGQSCMKLAWHTTGVKDGLSMIPDLVASRSSNFASFSPGLIVCPNISAVVVISQVINRTMLKYYSKSPTSKSYDISAKKTPL